MLLVFDSLNENNSKKEKDENGQKGLKVGKGEKGECITGNGDKCLICREVKDEYAAYNLGYKLENGQYILNHSFNVDYKTEKGVKN